MQRTLEISFTHGTAAEFDLGPYLDADGTPPLALLDALPAGVTLEGTHLRYDGSGATDEKFIRVANPSNAAPRVKVELTSTIGGRNLPFTFGQVFAKGHIPRASDIVANGARIQAVVRNRWDDGSVRFAVISGHADFQVRTPLMLTLTAGNPGTRNHLENSKLRDANPDASISFGPFGTVTLASLLLVPNQTCFCGPEMSEWHFRGEASGDKGLVAWFHVRLYANGRIWIRAIGENTTLDTAKPANREYQPQVKIGGKLVWNNDGKSLLHELYTRWTVTGWIGGDPEITVRHDTKYMMDTKLVPNYGYGPPAPAHLDRAYPQALPPYAPPGSLNLGWGSGGYDPAIGLITEWEVMYLTSNGDPRTWRWLMSHGQGWGRFPIHVRDPRTAMPLKLSEKPKLAFDGSQDAQVIPYPPQITYWVGNLERAPKHPNGKDEAYSLSASHSPTGPYIAYLASGDFYLWEELCFLGNFWVFSYTPNNREQTKGAVGKWLAPREFAWTFKCLGVALASCPDNDPMRGELTRIMENNIHVHADRYVPKETARYYNPIGWLFDSVDYQSEKKKRQIAPWMHDFAIASIAFTYDLDLPVSAAAREKHRRWRDHVFNIIVGRMGGEGDPYCYTHAAVYNMFVADKVEVNEYLTQPPLWYQSWSEVWQAQWGDKPRSPCSGPLKSIGGGKDITATAATDYWGNLQPALAYAVDSDYPGAAEAYRRMVAAPNWKAVISTEGFGNNPVWAVKPRKS